MVLAKKEGIVFNYLLSGECNARKIAEKFTEAGWDMEELVSLRHENIVSKCLRSLERGGLIVQIPQSEIREKLLKDQPMGGKRKRGRPKKDAPKKSLAEKNLGKFYAIDHTFLICLIRDDQTERVGGDASYNSIAPRSPATEEAARAFLLALERFSLGPQETIKLLGTIKSHKYEFAATVFGFILNLAIELQRFSHLCSTIHDNEKKAQVDRHYIQKLKDEKRVYASKCRYLRLENQEMEDSFAKAVLCFCVNYQNFYGDVLLKMKLRELGLVPPYQSRPLIELALDHDSGRS